MGVMNRIVVKYRPAKGNVTSCLRIYNDIKGLTFEPIGLNFFGKDAYIMLKIMQNVNYDNIEDCMNYGIEILKEEE